MTASDLIHKLVATMLVLIKLLHIFNPSEDLGAIISVVTDTHNIDVLHIDSDSDSESGEDKLSRSYSAGGYLLGTRYVLST